VCDATSALASLRLLSCVCWSWVFVPPTFHSCVLLAAGLFRVEHQSPFMSLGNAALATYPNNLSGKSSWVAGCASSTHVSVCYANTVQSRMWPWSYSVVRISYLRKPLMMAMPTDNSRTYQATISMMLSAVLLLLNPQAAKCSTLHGGARLTANVPVPVKFGPWRF
jgi:hypothetical protein